MQHSIQSFALDILRLLIWLILLAIIFVPLERLTPQNKQKVFRPEFWVDLSCYVSK